jgi:hypothetical protein
MVTSMPRLTKDAIKVCVECMVNKQSQKLISQKFQTRVKDALEVIYTDIWGPFSTKSLFRSRCFITFIDDYSRKTWGVRI